MKPKSSEIRKAKYFYMSKCKKCDPTKRFLDSLVRERHLILEEYDLRKDATTVQRYRVGTFPAVVITDANDDEKVFYIYQGKLSEAAQLRIIEELKFDED